MFWIKTETESMKVLDVRLEDIAPQHPEEYPARNLRARLEARRLELWELRSHLYA